ncbi:hypothetical protein E4U17_007699 [Claviceps sp. LM77 group G4]|nr:hypothetical protein E4U17_007699 [Claviceps sp. LM77 group G4]KAG6073792.1 hypothetical protein E4U33_002727 [Claviceps sp. LM78 group G4]
MTSISRLVAYRDSEDDGERRSAASPIEIGPVSPPATADPRLLPPPNFTAQDRATLIQKLGKHTLDKGYAIVLARSSAPRGSKSARIEFKCDIGGVPRDRRSSESQGPKRPNARSRLINCPFKATALQAKSTLHWSFTVVNPFHNHPPSESNLAHASKRRTAILEAGIVEKSSDQLSRGGSAPTSMVNILRQAAADTGDELKFKTRDLYNLLNANKRQKLLGKTTAELR